MQTNLLINTDGDNNIGVLTYHGYPEDLIKCVKETPNIILKPLHQCLEEHFDAPVKFERDMEIRSENPPIIRIITTIGKKATYVIEMRRTWIYQAKQ